MTRWFPVLLILSFGCSTGTQPAKSPSTPAADVSRASPISRSNLDTTCAPCRDFYTYANGGWLARSQIPAEYPLWGAFTELRDRNLEVLHQLLERKANGSGERAAWEKQLGTFYASCMDSARVEAAGLQPLEALLRSIAAMGDGGDLIDELARLHRIRVYPLFGISARPDRKQSRQMIANADQGGLGLPDRDDYLREDEKSRTNREEYVSHVARLLQLAGDDSSRATAAAHTVMGLETELAKASLTRVERRDPYANYHRMEVAAADTVTPTFAWERYLSGVGLADVKRLNIGQPGFFRRMSQLLASVPMDDWKTYFRWHLLNAFASSLPAGFVNENFRFNGQVLTGTKQLLPRWKRCVAATDVALGESLGRVYVESHFPPEAKARVLRMVEELHAALRERLSTLPWMEPETRSRALAKLDAFLPNMGYPERWRDYSTLAVESGPFATNQARAAEFETHRSLGEIGKPVDRREWTMTPPTVNAYYNSSNNSINFPAGIMQPPFFDAAADDAVNYGAMGAVIGHEMTHGFDDQGRKSDAEGNLTDWWTPGDAEQYTQRASRVERQFGGYVVLDSLHLNGKLTLGENIADLGGLRIAYAAFEHSLQGKPRPPSIDGFTPEQRFFLGWAQIWRVLYRPEQLRLLVLTNPHSPGQFRANGPLSNMPEFAKAWGCKAGDPMVRPDSLRAEIW